MKTLEFLMDDTSIKNDAFAVEHNIERIKDFTYNQSASMRYTNENSLGSFSNELGNNVYSSLIIL